MKRRSFVVSLAATTAASGLASACNEGDDAASNGGRNLDLLWVMQAYFGAELATGRMVGARYALSFEDDDALELDLQPVIEAIDSEDTVEAAVETLRALVQADFDDTTMVLVDGWALGLAEVRIAGLAEYVHQG